MTNLVVCCDGTWKRSDDLNVSNIERIARSVVDDAEGVPQNVYYSAGVGTGSGTDRLLGGALGTGLDREIVDCYRFLALHYRPGDAIYAFGFSRGAYTVRSLIGMISAVGLLTPEGVAVGLLPEALQLYRTRPVKDSFTGRVWEDPQRRDRAREFRKHCHRPGDVAIRFLGVFDTVGSLGVPVAGKSKYRFHDVRLSGMVQTARQALALADRRRSFTPCLWAGQHDDIEQMWFDGVHSDVGGGYARGAIADDTLAWMVHDASVAGLRFDLDRIRPSLHPQPVRAHNSLTFGYRVVNGMGSAWSRVRRSGLSPAAFMHGWRHPAPGVDESSATGVAHLSDAEIEMSRRPWNLRVAKPAVDHQKKAPWHWPVNPNLQGWLDELYRHYRSGGADIPGYEAMLANVVVEPPKWPAPGHDWVSHADCEYCLRRSGHRESAGELLTATG